MATKQQIYVNQIEKFLKENYVCYPLKMQQYDNKQNKTVSYIREETFVIETENAGLVMVRPDLFTCSKPYKYDVFTQKYAFEWANEKEKIFQYRTKNDGKFKKNNIYARNSVDEIKSFLAGEYKTTLKSVGYMTQNKVTKEEYDLLKSVSCVVKAKLKDKVLKEQTIGTNSQGVFEIDLIGLGNEYLAVIEILTGLKIAITLFKNSLVNERIRIFAYSADDAAEKLEALCEK